MSQENQSLKEVFKIGITLKNFNLSKFEKEILFELKKYKSDIKIIAILESYKNENVLDKLIRKYKQVGLIRVLEISLFKVLYNFEIFFLSFFYNDLKEIKKKYLIDKSFFFKIIEVRPSLSKYRMYSEYNNNDVEKINSENLDIILRGNASSIYKGEILNVAKNGIISFHHGDNSWNRGTPPGFWEVVLKKKATGFIIQILNKELDNGKVLFKGEFATKRTYSQNLYNILSKSNKYLVAVIIKIIKNEKIKQIFNQSNKNLKIYKSPGFKYIWKYSYSLIRLIFIKPKDKVN